MFKILNKIKKLIIAKIFELKKIHSVVWPIDWSKLQKQELVLDALRSVSKNFRVGFGVVIFCTIISGILLLQSFYYLITVKTATRGGTFYETSIEDSSIRHLSPVLSTNSPSQKKIISLLYEPLYKVIYPDFATSESEITIKPILLESEPIIVDSPSGKVLKMKLKPNLKWSNGSSIVADDVLYTFEKLKENKGNSDFKDIMSNYKLIVSDERSFQLEPIDKTKQNPQLINFANFSPISRVYNGNSNLDELEINTRALFPEAVSGKFKIPKKIKYLNKEVDNIYKDENKKTLVIFLENSGLINSEPSFIQNYVFTFFGDLLTTSGRTDSVEKENKSNKQVDLLIRDIDNSEANKSKTPELIKQKLGLEQVIIPTNTYISAFANVQTSQWLVNRQLRKYIFCNLASIQDYSQDNIYREIPEDKKFVPLQLGGQFVPSCVDSKQELLNSDNKSGKYSIENNVLYYNSQPVNISILTTESLLNSVSVAQNKLKEIGITSSLEIGVDLDSLRQKIETKDYNIAILPTTIVSKDIYPLFGEKSQDILGITKNNRIGKEETKFGQGVETNLKGYSDSRQTDQNLKAELSKTFQDEFMVLNLYQEQKEVNYSKKLQIQKVQSRNSDSSKTIKLFDSSVVTFPVDIFNNLEDWYIDNRDKLFFL
jgi:Bacterial extracellular solute-binding proteins, family 5 Middle